ncbi:SidA/IucD/PvdA family monooxygenase [Nitrospirillum amazonense]|uniref:SidA/IucD/PvdA family monooxygenase n=1 Tax=Nitrospirillum amazonense TaxID=28077 RepID=UPI002DD42673|nr:SidA/IucD/PvdA family monooxygenase [Nitrospirillum amazonense]MEC4593807.1 SidA/IucD/PvdA family monooxygenase [Nitrospirillum amazonense]
MVETVAVVGAGAKAAAIAARAVTLRKLGVSNVPNIIVFEAKHIGAAWSGASGYSSGFQSLCTPGEKDVGYPYAETTKRGSASSAISPALFAEFSWSAFLIDTGRLANWVDRGRDHPSHRQWAAYLAWVFAKAEAEGCVTVIRAEVIKVKSVGNCWEVLFQLNNTPHTITVAGVVLTGTGTSRKIKQAPGMPNGHTFDAETFWSHRNSILRLQQGTIVVAGDGGGAGTIVAWLAEHFAENELVFIQSITPAGTLFPRGDGYAERRWFSDPTDWPTLSLEHRQKILDRTEAGVVSLRLKNVVDRATNVGYVRGRATNATWQNQEISIAIEYDGQPSSPVLADYLISAIGFDTWSLLGRVDHPAVGTLRNQANITLRENVLNTILPDLTLGPISGIPPGLHVPALAGLARGPGMSNLGCLGLMATSVLNRYCK